MAKKRSTMARIGVEKLDKVRKRAKKQGKLIRDELEALVEKGIAVEESERGA